jgi:hypothetical protein
MLPREQAVIGDRCLATLIFQGRQPCHALLPQQHLIRHAIAGRCSGKEPPLATVCG